MGAAEYSYYFVLREFLPVLEQCGEVITISNPETEVDPIYKKAQSRNEYCVFLSFTPAHKTCISNQCPTVPVMAWEFNDIPNETWADEEKNDWRLVLGKVGQAITHSSHSVAVIRKAMRGNYPAISIPSPVWDRYKPKDGKPKRVAYHPSFDLTIKGAVIDTHSPAFDIDFHQDIHSIYKESHLLNIQGVIYTSILNPLDGRKNWFDMISAFCWAFKHQEDATLILKFTCNHQREWPAMVANILAQQPSCRARIIIIIGYLDDKSYAALGEKSSYVVNASHGEGQCLPLMEYMSSGTPAISPCHTGMADYINTQNSFIVDSSLEPVAWPDDTRKAFRTTQYRINWESLKSGFEKSYEIVTNDPDSYEKMSRKSIETLKAHCSKETAKNQLIKFFQHLELQDKSAMFIAVNETKIKKLKHYFNQILKYTNL
ncbi:MAG: glycosyltransferase involved in cell wall biosynthesis [Paraglaciecola sp.]|jgi:glycosyltransferase involved in cell wall biosynthesis